MENFYTILRGYTAAPSETEHDQKLWLLWLYHWK
jgi:hypothetical protein